MLDAERKVLGFKTGEQRQADWFHSSSDAISRRAELSDDAAKLGIDAPRSGYDDLKRQAFNVLVKRGELTGTFDQNKDDWFLGRKQKIEDQLLKALQAEAVRVGINARQVSRNGGIDWDFGEAGTYTAADSYGGDERSRGEKIMRINSAISAKGGNTSEALLMRIAESNERIAVEAKRGNDAANQGTPEVLGNRKPRVHPRIN